MLRKVASLSAIAFTLLTQNAQAQSVFDRLQAMDDDAAQGEANERAQSAIRAAGYAVENHVNRAKQYLSEAISDSNDNPHLVCYDLNAAASEYGDAVIAYRNATGEELTELNDKMVAVESVERSLGC